MKCKYAIKHVLFRFELEVAGCSSLQKYELIDTLTYKNIA